MIPRESTRPLVTAGTVIGIGMGGFVDGILFHQILQLHNMLSNWVLRDSLVQVAPSPARCCWAGGCSTLWRA